MKEYERFLAEIREVRNILKEDGIINFCFIKLSDKIHSDIDLLTPNLDEVMNSLIKHGFKVKRVYRTSIILNKNGRDIDVHRLIEYHFIRFIDERKVVKNSVHKKIGNLLVPYPSPTDDLLITIIHAIFDRKIIQNEDILKTLKNLKKTRRKHFFSLIKRYNLYLPVYYFLSVLEREVRGRDGIVKAYLRELENFLNRRLTFKLIKKVKLSSRILGKTAFILFLDQLIYSPSLRKVILLKWVGECL